MTFRKSLSALLASSLAIGSTAAVAAPLGETAARQAAPVAGVEELAGTGMGIGWIIALLVAAGVALVIVEDDSGGDEPLSP